MRPVAEALAALQAPPDQQELAGWGAALSAYREVAVPGTSRRSRARRPRLIPSLLSAKLAAAASVAVAAVLGGGVAAYTGSLPAALQRLAHDAIAAPDVRASGSGSAHPASSHGVGPSAAGRAVYGLCTAYRHAQEHGNATQRAVAFRNLVTAAGGASKVAAYCAQVPHPAAASQPGHAGHTPPGHLNHRNTPPSHGNGNGAGNGGNGQGNGNPGHGNGGNGHGNR